MKRRYAYAVMWLILALAYSCQPSWLPKPHDVSSMLMVMMALCQIYIARLESRIRSRIEAP